MTVEDLKKQYAHLPHVKKVWVKNSDVYLVPVNGGELVDLTEIKSQDEKPVKPNKAK